LHILIDLQGLQYAAESSPYFSYALNLTKAIVSASNEHQVSILLNGLDTPDHLNRIIHLFSGLIPRHKFFNFSGVAPIDYQISSNHARYKAIQKCRNVAISQINPHAVLIMGGALAAGREQVVFSAPELQDSWKTYYLALDLEPEESSNIGFQPPHQWLLAQADAFLVRHAAQVAILQKNSQIPVHLLHPEGTIRSLESDQDNIQMANKVWDVVKASTPKALMDPKEYLHHMLHSLKEGLKLNRTDKLGLSWAIARNNYGNHRRKLLIDISVLVSHDAKTGIQRVSRSILSELLRKGVAGYEIRPVYFIPGQCYRYADRFLKEHFKLDLGADEPVLFTKDDVLLVTDLVVHSFPAMNIQLQNLRRAGAMAYFIVYDILPILHPEWCREDMQMAFPLWLGAICEHADGLICISASVAAEVNAWIAQNKSQIKINPYLQVNYFHLGADLESSMPSLGIPTYGTELLVKMQAIPSFLMVGTLEPRKGHAQVLAAFEALWHQGKDYCLVIVGKQGWRVQETADAIRNHPHWNKNLFWLSDISDEFLEKLYQVADALIFASFGEGFGLPLIEAAHKNLPLIIRDIPVFREIAKDSAYYFNGDNPEVIVSAIDEWLQLFTENRHPQSKDMHWLDWHQSTEQLLQRLPLQSIKDECLEAVN